MKQRRSSRKRKSDKVDKIPNSNPQRQRKRRKVTAKVRSMPKRKGRAESIKKVRQSNRRKLN